MNKVVIGALHLLGLYTEDEVADTIPAPAVGQCQERESGGVQGELEDQHRGAHSCAIATERWLRLRG